MVDIDTGGGCHQHTQRALRQRLRQARRSLTPREQRNHAQALARRLGTDPRFLRAERIGAYLSTDGELDLRPLLRIAWRSGTRCYLPVLGTHPKRRLWFAPYRPGDRLNPNRYGIPEPRLGRARCLPRSLDLLLVPLVGFDAQCNRLGMGGGYYDRTLAYLHHRSRWKKPRLLGIAHECQRVPHLSPNPWDIPLDCILTEAREYRPES